MRGLILADIMKLRRADDSSEVEPPSPASNRPDVASGHDLRSDGMQMAAQIRKVYIMKQRGAPRLPT